MGSLSMNDTNAHNIQVQINRHLQNAKVNLGELSIVILCLSDWQNDEIHCNAIRNCIEKIRYV